LRLKGVLVYLWQFRTLNEPLEGALRVIVNLDFFGAHPCFAFEFFGGYEEVEQRNQRLAAGGQEGLFLKPFEPVIAGIFTNHSAVFLFNEAVVVFLAVS
jgi:hypothetical protein